ncbi:MAG: methyltransferase domain-containing protein [Candidatus Sumerlaeota bacterium]|nr:methyltransferase domain-containing protein [Candidatus Sumerlaeota bacterium]
MKYVFDWMLKRRAAALADRIMPYLPSAGRALDIGAGTGHNAEALRKRSSLRLFEADVTRMNTTGAAPVLFGDGELPFVTDSFDCVLLFFVLQYTERTEQLMKEIRRIVRGKTIVIQSTYRGRLCRGLLRLRELFQGRIAFHTAKRCGWIPDAEFSLKPRRFFKPEELAGLFQCAGFSIAEHEERQWAGLPLSRDLYVLV